MKVTASLTTPYECEVTIVSTMKLAEWEKVATQLNKGIGTDYNQDAFNFAYAIRIAAEQVRKHFHGDLPGQEKS